MNMYHKNFTILLSYPSNNKEKFRLHRSSFIDP